MKASISRGIGHGFTVADVQIAEPARQEVLVDVRASGLCATDLSIVTHDTGLAYPFPAVLGHEIAGVAVQVGPAVRGVRVGDHVVGSLIQYCGACRPAWQAGSSSAPTPGPPCSTRAARA